MKTMSPASTPPATARTQSSEWPVRAAWSALMLLFGTLLAVAAALLIRSGIFSSGTPAASQITSVWAFLGVVFAAVATLIGALLTDQNNRAVREQARIAAEHEQQDRKNQALLAEEAEKRLTLDTVTRLLDHISNDQGYLPKARVAGAIATMIQLRAGAVAIRILGELWSADAVDTMTAVGLVNWVLEDENAPTYDMEMAATILTANATKLVPARGDADQVTENWPDVMNATWPAALPSSVKSLLLYLLIKVLLAREVEWWRERLVVPLKVLVSATGDPEFSGPAAQALVELADAGGLDAIGHPFTASQLTHVRQAAANWHDAAHWFLDLVAQFRPWARGEAVPSTQPGADLVHSAEGPVST